jgi:chromosome segregation ATPase
MAIKMSLSNRLACNSGVASWVLDEVRNLEAEIRDLKARPPQVNYLVRNTEIDQSVYLDQQEQIKELRKQLEEAEKKWLAEGGITLTMQTVIRTRDEEIDKLKQKLEQAEKSVEGLAGCYRELLSLRLRECLDRTREAHEHEKQIIDLKDAEAKASQKADAAIAQLQAAEKHLGALRDELRDKSVEAFDLQRQLDRIRKPVRFWT